MTTAKVAEAKALLASSGFIVTEDPKWRDKQVARVNLLIKQLTATFDEIEGVDYKIDIAAYLGDDHIAGAEECNNWERSWC